MGEPAESCMRPFVATLFKERCCLSGTAPLHSIRRAAEREAEEVVISGNGGQSQNVAGLIPGAYKMHTDGCTSSKQDA